MSKKNLSEELKQQIVDDWINGKKTVAQLADEHGCSEQSIRNWAKKKITDTPVYDKTSSQLVGEDFNNQVDILANRVPKPLFYSLEDASVLAKITVDQLFHYAIMGCIKAYIVNNTDYNFMDQVSINYYDIELKLDANLIGYKEPEPKLYKPFLLNVSSDDCKRLSDLRSMNIKKFPSIILEEGVHNFIIKFPQKLDSPNFRAFRKAIYGGYNFFYPICVESNYSLSDDHARKFVNINIMDVKFFSQDLDELIKKQKKLIHLRGAVMDLFATHANKSSLLVDLDQVAFELYGTFNPIKVAHYNTKEKISTYLIERFGFFKVHADVAAEVILPSSTNQIEDDNQSSYRPHLLQLLIQAWNDLCLKQVFTKESQIKYDIDAETWFKDKFKHELSRFRKSRTLLAKIILSDNAPFHNQRRHKK